MASEIRGALAHVVTRPLQAYRREATPPFNPADPIGSIKAIKDCYTRRADDKLDAEVGEFMNQTHAEAQEMADQRCMQLWAASKRPPEALPSISEIQNPSAESAPNPMPVSLPPIQTSSHTVYAQPDMASSSSFTQQSPFAGAFDQNHRNVRPHQPEMVYQASSTIPPATPTSARPTVDSQNTGPQAIYFHHSNTTDSLPTGVVKAQAQQSKEKDKRTAADMLGTQDPSTSSTRPAKKRASKAKTVKTASGPA